MSKITKQGKIIISLVVSFSLVAFIVFAFLNNTSVAKAIKPMVSRQPERVSELYFTNYSLIPKELETNRLYRVDFTITNREYRREIYTYRAIMVEDRYAKIIAKKQVNLNNNQSARLQILFRPTKPNAQIKIIIALLNRRQEIRFRAKT